jgi:hypothetical protein
MLITNHFAIFLTIKFIVWFIINLFELNDMLLNDERLVQKCQFKAYLTYMY